MQRQSRKRQAILDCLRASHSHPCADEIYRQLKPTHPDLSLATVYRNLGALKEAGLVASVGQVAGEERFDGDVRSHPHAVCRRCGTVIDLPQEQALGAFLTEIREKMENVSGFTLCDVSLRFTGLCPACRKEES